MKLTNRTLNALTPYLLLAVVGGVGESHAGFFTTAKFLEPGTNGVGIEPEVTTSSGGGVAANLRFQQGVSDLSNLHLLLGTGSDPRKFRGGASYTFDFIPDVDRQPGIGIALSGVYWRYENFGQFDATLAPYIHKAFYDPAERVVEPFLAIPIGPEFRSGEYNWAATLVLGGMFRGASAHMTFVGEVGVSLNRAESYVSGGVLITP